MQFAVVLTFHRKLMQATIKLTVCALPKCVVSITWRWSFVQCTLMLVMCNNFSGILMLVFFKVGGGGKAGSLIPMPMIFILFL